MRRADVEPTIEAIAEPAREPDDLTDRLLTAISTPEASIDDASGITLRQLKPGFLPSDVRNVVLNRVPAALERLGEVMETTDRAKDHIAYVDLLLKTTVGVVKGVSVENREFAKSVLQVVWEIGGPDVFNQCLPKIEALMMQLEN